MNIEDFRSYCLSMEGVTEKIPFGKFAKRYDSLLVFYVLGHMFCIVDIDDFTSVTVRSTPDEMENLRQKHSSVEAPGNPVLRSWIQLILNGDIPDSEILASVKRAYDIIRYKYTPKTPMAQHIKNLYEKRSKRETPEVVKSLKHQLKDDEIRRTSSKKAKDARREEKAAEESDGCSGFTYDVEDIVQLGLDSCGD